MTAIGAKITYINPETGKSEWGYNDPQTGTSGDILRKMHPEWDNISPPPIKREDGGLTQLQTNPTDPATVQVSRIDKNPFASISGNTGTFDLNNPTASAPMSAQEYAGLLSRFNLSPIPETPANIIQARSDVLGAYNPTAQETQYQGQVNDLQSQLTNLKQSEAKGLFNIEQQRIAMPLITGQQAALSRQAQLERGDVMAQIETAQRGLGYETAKRQGILQRATVALGFAQSDYDNQLKRIDQMNQNNMDIMSKVVTYAQGLQDNQRQALATIAKNFENSSQTFDQMTPQGQQGVMNLARQWGIDPQAMVAIIDSQVHNNLLKQQKDVFDQKITTQKLEEDKRQFNATNELQKQKLAMETQLANLKNPLEIAKLKADIAKTNAETTKIILGGSALSIADAQKLGVPYGTTRDEAIAMGKTPGANSDAGALKEQALKSANDLLTKFKGGQGTSGVGFGGSIARFVTGLVGGTSVQDFQVQFNNLKSLLSLDNVKYLKGQGQVSDAERRLLSEASAKLDLSQSESEFESALLDVQKALSGNKLTSPDGIQEVNISDLTPAQIQEAKSAGWK